MNKRGNIILGKDQRAYLIDFQISVYLPQPLLRKLLVALQNADIYHLYKHKRKLSRNEMSKGEYELSRNAGQLIQIHRLIANPYKQVRRMFFRYLYQKGVLAIEPGMRLSKENDPRRFLKS